MTAKPPAPPIVSSLDALAATGGRWLWKSRLRDGLRARLPRSLALLLVMPSVALAVTALGWVFGQPWKLPLVLVAVLCPLPCLLDLGWRFLQLWRKQLGRRQGLAVLDEMLDLKDRLQTADDFLARPQRTPFMEAAIEDARPALDVASQRPPEWHWGKSSDDLRRWLPIPLLAIILIVTGVFLPVASRTGAAPETPGGEAPGLAGELPLPPAIQPPAPAPQTAKPPRPQEKRPDEQVRKATKGEPAPAKIDQPPSEQLTGREKISMGTSEGGQTSQAASSGRASESQGMPGNQAPPSEPEKPLDFASKDAKPAARKPAGAERKKVEDQSGATAGRGSSGGSSRNPASSDWAGKDRTETADNEQFEQEENVEDEESASEARGGLQPNLRDRRPPVNRDLSIGFGNQSSEDSNGRGGPGDRKKSRGVAGLVLGVPVPDHVKGQPNPGQVKVTQERVRPQAEDMPGAAAEDRGRRTSPAGHLSERTLDTSMKRIVREYFLKTRAADVRSSETKTSNE